MSRSGYSDDCDGADLNLWRGAVNQGIRGKRGQAFLRETLAALDAMPVKKLTTDSLHETASGEFCTLGAVGAARGMDMGPLELIDVSGVAKAFGIAHALAAEIMYMNDDEYDHHSPAHRWSHMRHWITSQIKETS